MTVSVPLRRVAVQDGSCGARHKQERQDDEDDEALFHSLCQDGVEDIPPTTITKQKRPSENLLN